MGKKIELQVLEPFGRCHNPIKCYFPNTDHIDCGEDWITRLDPNLVISVSIDQKEEKT